MKVSATLALVGLLALVACGDDDGAAIDAAPPADAHRFADAGLIACSAELGCPAGRTATCDLARGQCVECVGDPDCGSPDALGPTCADGAGYCTCDSAADCVGRSAGSVCHPVVRACTCGFDHECSGDATCEPEPYLGAGVRTCRPARD